MTEPSTNFSIRPAGFPIDPRRSSQPARIASAMGATRYVGAALCRRLVQRGQYVRVISRLPQSVTGRALRLAPYNLRTELPPGALKAADAVIHLAAETGRAAATEYSTQLLAVHRLLAAGARARFVFVSSPSARADAPTADGGQNGQTKRRCLPWQQPCGA
jgi:nucleoside-diphosphate-sugar epimerase